MCSIYFIFSKETKSKKIQLIMFVQAVYLLDYIITVVISSYFLNKYL